MSEQRYGETPPCKGCGSTNLIASTTAEISSTYDQVVGVRDGELFFAFSESGYGENERIKVHCGDCGRRMRTKLWPAEVDR